MLPLILSVAGSVLPSVISALAGSKSEDEAKAAVKPHYDAMVARMIGAGQSRGEAERAADEAIKGTVSEEMQKGALPGWAEGLLSVAGGIGGWAAGTKLAAKGLGAAAKAGASALGETGGKAVSQAAGKAESRAALLPAPKAAGTTGTSAGEYTAVQMPDAAEMTSPFPKIARKKPFDDAMTAEFTVPQG